jgi:hypothetical protein
MGVVAAIVGAVAAVATGGASLAVEAAATDVVAGAAADAAVAGAIDSIAAVAAPSILSSTGEMLGAGMLTAGVDTAVAGSALTGIGGIAADVAAGAGAIGTTGEIGGANLIGTGSSAALDSGLNAAVDTTTSAVADGSASSIATDAAASTASSINTDALLKAAGQNALKGAIIGGAKAGLTGGNILEGAVTGGVSGGIGGATGNFLTQEGYNPIISGAGAGAASGATGAVISGGDIGQGALTGGVTGGVSGGAKMLGDSIAGTSNSTLGKTLSATASQVTPAIINGSPTAYTPTSYSGGLPTTTTSGTTPTTTLPAAASDILNPFATSNANDILNPTVPGHGAGTNIEASLPGITTTGSNTDMNINQLAQLYPQLHTIDSNVVDHLTGNANIPNYYTYGANTANQPTAFTNASSIAPNPGYPATASTMATSGSPLNPTANSLTSAGLSALSSGQIPVVNAKDGGHMHVPEFVTGATGHFVQGKGDGQSDDIPAMLADGEYVFDADTVAAIGNGSSKAGAEALDKMREAIRKHKRSAPTHKIPPKAKSPLEYLKG